MPDPLPPADRPGSRSSAERAADHAAIDRLAAELLPSLIAKLGATGLGELEVREGGWRVRLRRPAGGSARSPEPGRDRRPGERERGEHRDHRGERHVERRPERSARGHDGQDGGSARSASRTVATSPAVGVYRPRADLAAGDRVRAGDRIGAVEMLGIPQEVVAPVDAIVGSSLVESGDAVEYGQELLVLEVLGAAPPAASTNGST